MGKERAEKLIVATASILSRNWLRSGEVNLLRDLLQDTDP